MNARWLQVRDHTGAGFRPLVAFGAWRVAILRPERRSRSAGVDRMERHLATDEVFVLTRGRGIILIGGRRRRVERFWRRAMQPGAIYNVRRNVWHTVLLSPDASLVIVENRDTGAATTEYAVLTRCQLAHIRSIQTAAGMA